MNPTSTSDPNPGRPYVPEHVASAVEVARRDSSRDLVPWGWFTLGWFGTTLPIWRAFGASGQSIGGNELHRSVPAALGGIETAMSVLGSRVPEPVREEVVRLVSRVRDDHEDLARARHGLPLLHGGRFETGVEAVRDLHYQIRGVEPTVDSERPWWHLGCNLGAWAFWWQFDDAPLAALLADLLDTCRDLPAKVVATLPPLVGELTRLPPPDPVAEDGVVAELARQVKQLCQPEWNPHARPTCSNRSSSQLGLCSSSAFQ